MQMNGCRINDPWNFSYFCLLLSLTKRLTTYVYNVCQKNNSSRYETIVGLIFFSLKRSLNLLREKLLHISHVYCICIVVIKF